MRFENIDWHSSASDLSSQYSLKTNNHYVFEYNAELILGLHAANERRRYKVTPSLIDWAQT